MVETLWYLIAAHVFGDYVFQSTEMSKRKNPRSVEYSDTGYLENWAVWLFAHSMIHGTLVSLVTGNVSLGVCELLVHFATDYSKCRKRIGHNTDQTIHVACKLLWAVLA